MAEARSRRETNPVRTRTRSKNDLPPLDAAEEEIQDIREMHREESAGPSFPAAENNDFVGYDEEVNNRYEEIKRGGTHISELQHMTMPQLLKTAKEEGITAYTGLKKQDLIFK